MLRCSIYNNWSNVDYSQCCSNDDYVLARTLFQKPDKSSNMFIFQCERVIVVIVQVSCAVSAYWKDMSAIRSRFMPGVADYFVGLKCYAVMNSFCVYLT